jgi:hypothetical protein
MTYAPPIAPNGSAMTHEAALARQLHAHALRLPRPMLPPSELVARYDPALGAAIAGVGAAEAEATRGAVAWQRATIGAELVAACDAERTYVAEHVGRGEDAPPRRGPLYEHLTIGVPSAYVAAFRALAVAELRDAKLRDDARNAERLRDRLDGESDELSEQIADALTRARDRKSSRDWDEAVELREAWGATTSVHAWLCAPERAWKQRGYAWPEPCGMRAYEADAAVTGVAGPLPPIEGGERTAMGAQRVVSDATITPKTQRRSLLDRFRG